MTWHSASLTQLLPRLLSLLNHLFYPFIGGVRAGPPGLEFVFLLDPPEQHTLVPFPRNWLAIPSGTASFGKEDYDPVEIVADFQGQTHQRASHQRYQHRTGFSVEERIALLRWYVGRLNRFLYELADVANFTEDGDVTKPVDPVFGYEYQITVDRLMRKTVLTMSLDDAPGKNGDRTPKIHEKTGTGLFVLF